MAMRILRKLTKFLFLGLYAIAFGEIFLRLFAPVAVFPRYVTASSYGIRVNEPNKTYWHTSADVSLEIKTNSKGIRSNEEISYEAAPGVKRILVLGDSFAMGYESTFEQMFTTQMEVALKSAGVNAQVVNLAVSGHSNAEELIVLREEGLKYHPDLVLLCWHLSDLNENVRSGLFEFKQDQLTPKSATYLPGVAVQRRLNEIPGFEFVSTRSHLYSWIREFAATRVIKPLLTTWQNFKRTKTASDTAHAAASEKYAEKLTIAILRQIQSTAQDAGAKFLILDIPSPAINNGVTTSFPSNELKDGTELPVVSPIPSLRDAKGLQVFHERSHRHFTPKACKVVGEFLAAEIISAHLLSDQN